MGEKVEVFDIMAHQFGWARSKSFPNLLEDEKFSGHYLHTLNILYLSLHKRLYIHSNQQISEHLWYIMVNILSFSIMVTFYKTMKITAYPQKVI